MNKSHVYVFGSGDCGQLGLGEQVDLLPRPQLHPYFEDKSIVAIAAGGLHTLALSSTGIVYSWGCNDEKALGHTAPEFAVAQVGGPLQGQMVIQIAAGDSISAALTSEGRIYSWGTFRDSKGVIGHGARQTRTSRITTTAMSLDEFVILQEEPTLLEALLPFHIVAIAAGSNHLMAIDREGQLFAWGCGEQGQLGRRVLERHKLLALRPTNVTPRLGRHRVRVQRVICGSYHTLVMGNQDNVNGNASKLIFAMGLNNFGQLGLGDHQDRITAELIHPTPWDSSLSVVDAAAGEHHTLILTGNGQVWASGRADWGQLGIDLPDNQRAAALPQPITTIPGLGRLIAAGGNHNMVVTLDGTLYTWGYGEMHQLGHGPDEIARYPKPVQFPFLGSICQISAGGQHSVVLTASQE